MPVLVILLILIELGCAAFIFFDKSWEDVSVMLIVVLNFKDENWKIVKWVALAAVILELTLKNLTFDYFFDFLTRFLSMSTSWVSKTISQTPDLSLDISSLKLGIEIVEISEDGGEGFLSRMSRKIVED
ncbi:hypothetical protein CK203_026699 [Vitis vinifera]|uniref:Uncharacterized protein n=1 Tax=Vitis vinifera TaxID=29760 RepID=A0A438ITW3_VITVI|nr:hypothetical protein CK203_026699 [Vitis vinifera]